MPAERAGPLRVSVVRDPDDLPATTERVRLLNDPDRAILVIRPLPYTTSMNDFAFCVLDGLGKHLPAAPPPGLWNQTLAWVNGYRLRHLVVDRAHTLKPDFRGPLRELLGPPRPRQPRLWLIDAGQAKRRSVVRAFGDLDGLEAVVNATGAEGLDQVRPEVAPPPAAIRDFLERVCRLCGHSGGLIIGVDLQKSREILEAAYNDSAGVTAAFNLNLLVRANRELGADFDLSSWRHRAVYNQTLGRIEMHLLSERAQMVHLGGREFHFAPGEKIISESPTSILSRASRPSPGRLAFVFRTPGQIRSSCLPSFISSSQIKHR